MKEFVVMNGLVRIAAFVCITVAAMYFQRAGILWWYLLSALMGVSWKKETIKTDE